jgi:hypothetical protein
VKTDADLEAAGRAAIAEAARLWQLDIIDPEPTDLSERADKSREQIDSMLRACGWTWQIPYKGNRQLEWCGVFAGACWKAAGLDPRWLLSYFSSTYRLDIWARYFTFDAKSPNPKPAAGVQRRRIGDMDRNTTVLPFEPRAGDILLIGDGTPKYGDHITLVESYDAATHTFTTIEGNGHGFGPDGKRREGVVRAKRYLGGSGYCARRLIRPAPSDLL